MSTQAVVKADRRPAWWAQFREIALPRCRYWDGQDERCDALIWPWQAWICEVEEWPRHHSCHHRNLTHMLAWLLKDERDNPSPTHPGYHWDGYDACDFCGMTTDSGFTVEAAP